MYQKSAFTTIIENYPETDQHLVHNTLTKATIVINNEYLSKITSPIDVAEISKFDDLKTMAEMGIIVDDQLNEKRSFQYWINSQRYEKEYMDHVILTSTHCNLDCQYCTARKLNTSNKKMHMTKEVADKYLAYLESELKKGKKKFSIEFFGGEPLMNMKILEYVAVEVGKLEKAYGVETHKKRLTTNGTLLTPAVVEKLSQCGIGQLQVTVDGPKAINDTRKVYVNRQKSAFDSIISGVKNASRRLLVDVRCNLDAQNYEYVDELIDYMADSLKDHIDYFYCYPTLAVDSPGNEWNEKIFTPEQAGHALVHTWKRIVERGFKLPGFIQYFPCGALFERSAVIYPDGRKVICTGLIDEADKFYKGTLDGDACTDVHIHFMESNPWEKCPVCIHLPYCGGGCRWRALMANGKYDDVLCEKPFFDIILNEWLKLEWSKKGNGHEHSYERALKTCA